MRTTPFSANRRYCHRMHGNTCAGFVAGFIVAALLAVGTWYWTDEPTAPAFRDFREVAPINRTDLSNQLATPEPEPTPVGLGA